MATISETKNHLSAFIHEARRGETIIVLDRKKPVARIESISPLTDEASDLRLTRLERDRVLLKPRGGSLDTILGKSPPRSKGKASAVSALREEQEEGR